MDIWGWQGRGLNYDSYDHYESDNISILVRLINHTCDNDTSNGIITSELNKLNTWYVCLFFIEPNGT